MSALIAVTGFSTTVTVTVAGVTFVSTGVAVIVTVPAFKPVIFPLASTVATASSEDVYFAVRIEASAGTTSSLSAVASAPAIIVYAFSSNDTDSISTKEVTSISSTNMVLVAFL